jgi:hypothetical protein
MHWPKQHRNADFGYNRGVPAYPDNWKDLAKACKDRAGWRCEECGGAEHLGAAHVNHDLENPNPELRCLCWPCHRAYDIRTGANHPGKKARRLATLRRNIAKRRAEQEKAAAPYVPGPYRPNGYGLRRYSTRTAHKVRIEYLYTLWHISCIHALRRNLYAQTVWTRNYIRI